MISDNEDVVRIGNYEVVKEPGVLWTLISTHCLIHELAVIQLVDQHGKNASTLKKEIRDYFNGVRERAAQRMQ